MTRKHFEQMAAIVRSILVGEWTHICPSWADNSRYEDMRLILTDDDISTNDENYTRAVQTAEAFIVLASTNNPRFDRDRFLVACGLVVKPTKKRKA